MPTQLFFFFQALFDVLLQGFVGVLARPLSAQRQGLQCSGEGTFMHRIVPKHLAIYKDANLCPPPPLTHTHTHKNKKNASEDTSKPEL